MAPDALRTLVNQYWSPEKDIRYLTDRYTAHIKLVSQNWRDLRGAFVYVNNPTNRAAMLARRGGEDAMNEINADVLMTWELAKTMDTPHLRKALTLWELKRKAGSSERDEQDYIQLRDVAGNWKAPGYGVRGPPTCACPSNFSWHGCKACQIRREIERRLLGIPVLE